MPHFFVFLITVFTLVSAAFVQPVLARQDRNEDLALLSDKYQKRIVQSATITDAGHDALSNWSKEIARILRQPKTSRPSERDLQDQFFTDVFVRALGYEKRRAGADAWTLQSEFTTDVDVTRPDGVLGFFSPERADKNVQVVIELKSPGVDLDLRQNRKRDRRTSVDQAFSYAHKFDDVDWVIVSNYNEVRLYNTRSSKYALHFDLTTIMQDEQQLRLFFLLLHKDNLIAQDAVSTSTSLYNEREEELLQITQNFYRDYKAVRLATADYILNNNDGVTVDRAVAYAQNILDRILFIAFLEDLHLIPAETIEKAYSEQNAFNPSSRWDNFKGLFRAMDLGNPALNIPEYNGGLFRAYPEILDLTLPDTLFDGYKTLADYDFLSDLRVNILGHVFEQSITDIDVLKANLRGEESDDTRRHDEGAHYTPDIVTTYLIEKTLGAYLADIRTELGFEGLPEIKDAWRADKTNKTRRKHIAFWEAYTERLKGLKIVDPSCGSGAFLVAAFDYLEEEGLRVNKELEALDAPRLFSNWDRDILKNNLYGVDLSPEAAEITRLSLWLKIAKNKEKLVALDHNIRAGNAVVDDPAYAGDLAFDWQAAFPEVTEQGGFDLVIGNPPYVRHELITDIKPALKNRFTTYVGTADLFVYFYELGFNLLKDGGYLGYITSNKWMRAKYGKPLRAFIKDNATITSLIDLGEDDIFDDAVTYTNIISLRKQPPAQKSQFITNEPPFGEEFAQLDQARLDAEAFQIEDPIFYAAKDKIESKGVPLGSWDISINRGITTGFNEAFVIDGDTKDKLIREDPRSSDLIKPFLRGRDIERWFVENPDLWLIFTRRGVDIDHYPGIKAYLEPYYDRLKPRNNGEKIGRSPGNYAWYEIQNSTNYHKDFEEARIVWSKTASDSQFSFEESGFYQNNTSHYLISQHGHYLAAILNSKLTYWYLYARGSILSGGFLEFVDWLVKLMPIPQISEAEKEPFIALSKSLHDLAAQRHVLSIRMTNLLKQEFGITKLSAKLTDWSAHDFKTFLSELKKQKIVLKGENKDDWFDRHTRLKDQIKGLEAQIAAKEQELNTLVYALYGLTPEEIAYIQ